MVSGVKKKVFYIGATSRRELLDEALLRVGRLDHLIHIPLLDLPAQQGILEATLRKSPSAPNFPISSNAQKRNASLIQEVPIRWCFRRHAPHARKQRVSQQASFPCWRASSFNRRQSVTALVRCRASMLKAGSSLARRGGQAGFSLWNSPSSRPWIVTASAERDG